jgi:hypothetical protein
MTSEAPSDSLDLRHAATDRATMVVVPERRLLAMDGVGGPTGTDFRLASDVLRTVAAALRRQLLQVRSIESRIGLLEAAWWIHPELPPDEMADAFVDRSPWHWQQMIEIPTRATDEDADAAITETRQQAAREVPLVRLISIVEGRAAQILHLGDATSEPEALRKLHDAVAAAGLRPRGHVHQIFLVDPERVPRERARSIFRLPVEGA